MKRGMLYAALVCLLLAVLGYVFRGPLLGSVMSLQIGPDHAFGDQAVPAAPNYSSDSYWAALPGKVDPADERPATLGETSAAAAGAPPVFFIHPTSYINKASWNQPLDDATANWVVDQRVLRHQASTFNSCCEVYAPRYRQATFYSFMADSDSSRQALELAYTDVVAAFDEFLRRIGPDQPFILAGHSQGTKHGARLLAERIANSAQAEQLIAAYLIGFSITAADLGGTPVCDSATRTGCVVGWNAIDGTGRGAFAGIDNMLCVNPLNWRIDNAYAAHELNEGAIGYASYLAAPDQDTSEQQTSSEDLGNMAVEVAIADAQCKDGQLFVPALRSSSFPQRMLGNSMHVYDYSLFHMNIRTNSVARVSAYMAQQGAQSAGDR